MSFTDIDDDCHLLLTVTHKCQGKTFFFNAKPSFSRQNVLSQGKLSSLGKTFFLKENFLLRAKLSFSRQNFLLRAKLSLSRQNLLSLGKAFFSRPLPCFSILRMCSSQCFHVKDGRAQQGGDARLDQWQLVSILLLSFPLLFLISSDAEYTPNQFFD